jgi:hypothetical protein
MIKFGKYVLIFDNAIIDYDIWLTTVFITNKSNQQTNDFIMVFD